MPRRVLPVVRALSAGLLIATALAACTAGTPDGLSALTGGGANPSGTSPSGTTADFTDCSSAFDVGSLDLPTGRRDRLSFGCARITVPVDWSAPTGRTLTLQLVRVHDSANTAATTTSGSRHSLLVNPGGPGGSGVETAVSLAAQVSDAVLAHYDLVGFDPRGVGLSSPVRCLSNAQKDEYNAASPDVRSAAGFAEAKAAARTLAAACTTRYGANLPYIDTVQTARDMDAVRRAVGDDTMNYLGFSYGTELGGVYAHLFPKTVGRMVLDGAVDPLADDITSYADQLQGFEASFDQFATWCRTNANCSAIGDPRRAVYAIAAAATRTPIPSRATGETRRATSSLVYTAVLSALYSESQWPTLGSALVRARQGDSSGLLTLADQYNERSSDGTYSNISDANTAISCNDSRPGPTDATIRATATSWTTRFPIFGLWSVPSLFTCQQWQPRRTPVPRPTAAGSRPILVVGNLNDPATPYRGAQNLTRTLGNARLLTWNGEGHTSYLQGSTCIDRRVDTYLVSGTLPPANTTCPR